MSGSLLGVVFVAFLTVGTLAIREQAEGRRLGYQAETLRSERDRVQVRVARYRAAVLAGRAGDALRLRGRALGLLLEPAIGFPVLLPDGKGPAWETFQQATRVEAGRDTKG
jgi:hypothetical protein